MKSIKSTLSRMVFAGTLLVMLVTGSAADVIKSSNPDNGQRQGINQILDNEAVSPH